MKQVKYCFFAAALVLMAACSPKLTTTYKAPNNGVTKPITVPLPPVDSNIAPFNPHAVTNLFYMAKADSLLALARRQKAAKLSDSLGMPVPSEWIGSVNFGIRKPNYVIIHFTAQDSIQQTIRTFTVQVSQTSAHYVIGKDGKVYHMVNDYLRANQAGVGKWGSVIDMNSCSLGIEIDNNGDEPFTDAQIKSLLILLDFLKKTYNIPTANFIGHQDFAPKRKPDPGPLFPWKILAQHGFGYWADDELEEAPSTFDAAVALRLIGYDTSDLNAAIVAFKRHFVQTDITPQLTQQDLNILYNVYKKY